MARVMSYETGERLSGDASDELVEMSSKKWNETGAVPACRDADGVWQYVAPENVSRTHESPDGAEVLSVYVID